MVELLEVPHESVARSLTAALGGSTWCWSFGATCADVDGARSALGTMLDEGQQKLLASLRRGDAFSAAVKTHSSKRDGQPLLRLGRTRVMWLLGASPEEGDEGSAKNTPKAPRKRRRKAKAATPGARDGAAKPEDPESPDAEDLEDSESASQDEDAGSKTGAATRAFLASLRAKRGKN